MSFLTDYSVTGTNNPSYQISLTQWNNLLADLDSLPDNDTTYELVTTSVDGLMAATDKVKLDAVNVNATQNSSDADLRDRATHTGTQDVATITGLTYFATGTDAANLTGTLDVARITNGSLTLAKQADVATGTVFYRKTGGSGAPETQTLATLKADLGLTGTNTGDQTTITGNAGTATALQNSRNFSITGGGITASAIAFNGTANVALNASVDAGHITLARMANVNSGTVFYRKTASAGVPEVQTLATLKTDLGLTGTNSGDQTITLTGDVTGSGTGSFATTINASFYKSGGTDVALADGGTGASLSDPNADRILFWDDSAGQVTWLTLGTNLSITGTTLDASGGGGGLSDGDKGDVVVASSGASLTVESATPFGGTFDVTGRVVATKTTEQLRLAYDATKFVPFVVDTDRNLTIGSTHPDLIKRFNVKYSGQAGYGVSGLCLHDDYNGPAVVLQTIAGPSLYITNTSGTAVPLTLGTWTNPTDSSTFTAGSGQWTLSSGNLVLSSGGITTSGTITAGGDITVPDEAYDATNWNGNLEVPTKNAVRDALVALSVGGVSDGDKGDVAVSSSGSVWTVEGATGLFKPVAGVLNTGTVSTRIENSGATPPTGAAGPGLEIIGNAGGGSYLLSFNRTAGTHTVANYDASDHVFSLSGSPQLTLSSTSATFGVDVIVPDEAYDATNWNANLEAPTKNAVRDKIETVVASIPVISDTAFAGSWNGVTADAPSKNAVYDAAVAMLSSYRTILDCSGSHIAARVAGTYGFAQGQPVAISGTGTLYALDIIYIDPNDYPSAGGMTAKLRIRCSLMVNDVAPTGNYTLGLHPVTRPGTSGGAGLNIMTLGAAVSGSTVTLNTPAADSINNIVGSDFAVPAAGHYCIGVVTTATVAASSHVHMSAALQLHHT